MCLGIPGKITLVFEEAGVRMGRVDFGEVERVVCLAYEPEANLGEYVIVHAGFAISRLDEETAQHTLALLQEMHAAKTSEK